MSNIKNIVEKFSELSECSSIFVGSKIPNKKLNNARNKYAQDAIDVYLLIDCTVFGSAKEGMLVAENGVYARNTLSNPVFLKYDQITSIELDESKEKLLINGEKYLFFVGIDEHCKNLIVEMLLEVAQIALVNDQQIDNRNNEISDESFCVSCGAVLSLNSKFCNECGVKQELNCNDCGVALAQGSKFCSECGSPVGVDSKDDQKADAKLEPKLKPEPENSKQSAVDEMSLMGVIEKIKKEYSDHEDLDEIVSDLEGDNFIDHWAGRFAQERFPANFEISKMLYQVHLKNAESFSDYNDTAESIADKDGINDQEYARELFKKAESLVEDLYDLRGLATAVGAANGLGDKEWSKELFKKAETQCEEADDVVSIAESVSNKDGLDDKKWAEVLYKKALEMSDDFDLIIGVGDSVLSSLNNKKWAEEIYRKAENNLGSLNEYNRLIYSLRDNLENTEWSNSIVSKAADALLSADDTFEFAGYPSEIIDLGRSVADENELNDKDRAKKIFTLIQGYQGVTDNLDAARAVIEIYDGDYIEEYVSKALEVAIANLESGYYCDIYNFIASELEDTERAEEYKSNYLEEMREDNDEYGGCEELFEGEGEDEYNESFQGDGRGQSDMPDARAPIVHVVASYDYDALSDKEGDDKINSIRDIVSALIASYKKSIRDTGGERYYIQTSNGLTKVDNSSQEYDVGDSNYFDEKEAIRVYISGDELVSWLDSEFMNMSAVFAENLSSLGDYDDSPRMYAYMKEDEDWVVQGYENGEYDTGYHSEGPEDDYFVKNIEGLEDMLPSIAWLENDQVDK